MDFSIIVYTIAIVVGMAMLLYFTFNKKAFSKIIRGVYIFICNIEHYVNQQDPVKLQHSYESMCGYLGTISNVLLFVCKRFDYITVVKNLEIIHMAMNEVLKYMYKNKPSEDTIETSKEYILKRMKIIKYCIVNIAGYLRIKLPKVSLSSQVLAHDLDQMSAELNSLIPSKHS